MKKISKIKKLLKRKINAKNKKNCNFKANIKIIEFINTSINKQF